MNRVAALSMAAVGALILQCGAAQAQQIYRWIDDQGRTHLSDTPPPPSVKRVERKRISGNAVEGGAEPFELKRAMQQAPVTLYTAPGCKDPCALARAALNKRGVPFKEVQVWDAESIAELERVTGGRAVPALRVGNSVQASFTQENYDNALDAGGYPAAGVLPARKQAAPEAPEGYGPKKTPAADQPESAPPGPLGPYAPRFSQ